VATTTTNWTTNETVSPLCAHTMIEVQDENGRTQHAGGRFRGVTHYDLSPIDGIPHPVFKSEKPEPPKWEKEVRRAVTIYGEKVIDTGGMSWDDLTQECYATVLSYEAAHAEIELSSRFVTLNLVRGRISDLHKYYERREMVSLDKEHENDRGDTITLAGIRDFVHYAKHDAEKSLLSHEKYGLLAEAFKSLSPIERRTIALYYFSGEPAPKIEDIAAILGEQVPTVKQRLARAKDTLRTRLHSKCWQKKGALMHVPIVTPTGVVRWYPGSHHTGLGVDKSLFLGIPTQERKLSPYYDGLQGVINSRSYRTGRGVPTPSDFHDEPALPDEIKHSLNTRRLKARPCANQSCGNDVILLGRLPRIESCPLCTTIAKLGLGKNCPFCQTEETRRKYCGVCANDLEVWRNEWWSHRMSARFRPFRRWDDTVRAFKESWCFDLTRNGLANTSRSAVFHEMHAGDKMNLVVYRDQPVFTLDILRPTEQAAQSPAVSAASLEVPRDVLASRLTRPAVLSDEEALDRQRRVMRSWQARARKKFEAFKREHKELSASDVRTLFAKAFPTEANLCTQHLCKNCGKFAGVKNFICEGCRQAADEVAA
jgi:RNA polymerase sigma factor (sigma-70 family)